MRILIWLTFWAVFSALGLALPAEAALSTKPLMPEFVEGTAWVNSAPLHRRDLQGKVVLVHFWNFSDTASLRAVPFMNRSRLVYSGSNFIALSIHVPMTAFELNAKSVTDEIINNEIRYPVVLDMERLHSQIYHNLGHPSFFLFDVDGRLRYTFYGEAHYAEIDAMIQDLLKESGTNASASLPVPELASGGEGTHSPVIPLGYARLAHFGNGMPLQAERTQEFEIPEYLQPDYFYLGGAWTIKRDSLQNLKKGARLVIRFKGNGVNLIAASAQKLPVKIRVRLDGAALSKDTRGDDLTVREDQSWLQVIEPRAYSLAKLPQDGQSRLLELTIEDTGLVAYRLEFGALPNLRPESEDEED